MKITEVRIKLMEKSDDRLRAFCSITFDDCFVIRDLKIIEGTTGPFVAMPSRKLTGHCPQCGSKNHLRANYCVQCGKRQPENRTVRDQDGRVKLYADIAHPINSECREMIQDHVIKEYEAELDRAEDPNYTSRYDDIYDEGEDFDVIDDPPKEEPKAEQPVAEDSSERRPADTHSPTEERKKPSEAKPAVSTQIEPAQSTPPPPHQPQRGAATPKRTAEESGGFGAGIFD